VFENEKIGFTLAGQADEGFGLFEGLFGRARGFS
jgi:hypothetical protein